MIHSRRWLGTFSLCGLAVLIAGWLVGGFLDHRAAANDARGFLVAVTRAQAREISFWSEPVIDAVAERRLGDWARTIGVHAALCDSQGEILAATEGDRARPWLNRLDVQRLLESDSRTPQTITAGAAEPTLIFAAPITQPPNTSPAAVPDVVLVAWSADLPQQFRGSSHRWLLWISGGVICVLVAVAMVRADYRTRQQLENSMRTAVQIADAAPAKVPVEPGNRIGWSDLDDALERLKVQFFDARTAYEKDRRRIDTVFAAMIEGVLALDSELRVTLANQAARDMLSLPSQKLLGRYAGALVRIPKFEAAIRQSREHSATIVAEFETVGRRRRILRMRAAPLPGADGSGLAIVLHDVTDLRRFETMRRDFVANVSHELKTPLAAIKAYTETLSLGAINDAEHNHEFLAQIEAQVNVLDQQITDLLHLARVESGMSSLEFEMVNLNDLCLQCVHLFTKEAQQRHIELKTSLSSTDPLTIRADSEAVMTILNNLLSNAIRYTRAEGKVVVATSATDGHVTMSVADTGIGIATEHQERIFERFYRVDKARSRELGGTGLGLAIVKHTVHALGASISLKSQVGTGSTFTVEFDARAE